MRVLSTTVIAPSGLERSATIRMPLTASVWASSLYGDGLSTVHPEGSASAPMSAAPSRIAGSTRDERPQGFTAEAAATQPVTPISDQRLHRRHDEKQREDRETTDARAGKVARVHAVRLRSKLRKGETRARRGEQKNGTNSSA